MTIVEALPHLVPLEDEASSKLLERAFRKRGIAFKLGARFQGVEHTGTGVQVTLENGKTFEAELLLVAVGRGPVRPASATRRPASRWTAASCWSTSSAGPSVPGVYAVGDLIPTLQLAHVGFAEGILVAEHIAGLQPAPDRLRRRPADHLLRPRGRLGRPHRGDRPRSATATTRSRPSPTTWPATASRRSSRPRAPSSSSALAGRPGASASTWSAARVGELIAEAQLIYNWEAYADEVAPLIHPHPTPVRGDRRGAPGARRQAAARARLTAPVPRSHRVHRRPDDEESRPWRSPSPCRASARASPKAPSPAG